jgi:hypothetical protein
MRLVINLMKTEIVSLICSLMNKKYPEQPYLHL